MAKTTDFKPPPVLDLREADAPALAMSTTVIVRANHHGHAWIHAHEVELTERSWSHGHRGEWTLDVRRRGATDTEHDVAVALRVGLTGVSFRMATGGRLWIDAFIAGNDLGLFRVPEPDWNQLEGATKCTRKDCRGKDRGHVIVGEGRYIPPPNAALFDRLRGLRVEIITGIER